MTITHPCLTILSDAQLLAEVRRLATAERWATAALIRSLMELDTRKLYPAEGCSSLFSYCTQVLRLSEHAAYGRIEAARAARRFPVVLDLLEDGSITLTTVRLIAAHLTPENYAQVLESARHRSKRDVEQIVARLRPLPDVATSVRKLPPLVPRSVPAPVAQTTMAGCPAVDRGQTVEAPAAAAPIQTVSPTAHRPVIAPLAPQRYRVQFTVSQETHAKLRRAQDLLRHTVPSGDPAAIFARALTLLVEKLEKAKCAATTRPRPSAAASGGSRHIPAAVRREVWQRDGGRCAFIGSRGRCTERGFLEFHHVVPYVAGGSADVPNIQLRCRAHNAFEAQLFFGGDLVRERSATWNELGPDRVGRLGAGEWLPMTASRRVPSPSVVLRQIVRNPAGSGRRTRRGMSRAVMIRLADILGVELVQIVVTDLASKTGLDFRRTHANDQDASAHDELTGQRSWPRWRW